MKPNFKTVPILVDVCVQEDDECSTFCAFYERVRLKTNQSFCVLFSQTVFNCKRLDECKQNELKKENTSIHKSDLLEEIDALLEDNERDLGAKSVLGQLRDKIEVWTNGKQ